MTQHRKHRGYASQRIVANYLRSNGFPYAEPVGAGRSGSDITGVLGIDFEVKARRGLVIAETIKQLADRAQDDTVGIGVLRMDGQGEQSIGDWPCIVRFEDLIALIRDAGYGEPR